MPAPAIADAEVPEPVDQRGARRRVAAGEYEAEQPRRALEVPRPDVVAGAGGQRRMQHARHLGPPLKPARDRERAVLMRLEPHGERAQPSAAKEGIVGRNMLTEQL